MRRLFSKTVVAVALMATCTLSVGAYSVGSQGSDVLLIQQNLVKRGYKIGMDGIFGNDTRRAVERFQADKGLTISGSVDAKTFKTLTGKAMPQAAAPQKAAPKKKAANP